MCNNGLKNVFITGFLLSNHKAARIMLSFNTRYLYGSSLIIKYIGQIEILLLLKTGAPSVLNINEMLYGDESGPELLKSDL